MNQDDTRGSFLMALKAARDAGKVKLTTFENGFVDDCYDAFNFSPRMRNATDKIIAKYASEIGFHDSKSTLAALAKKEEDKIRTERRATQCVAVGGKLVRGPVKRVTAAQYKHP